MRNLALLLGIAAVLAALVIAGGQAILTHQIAHANATLAGGVFTIPLAAALDLDSPFFAGAWGTSCL